MEHEARISRQHALSRQDVVIVDEIQFVKNKGLIEEIGNICCEL